MYKPIVLTDNYLSQFTELDATMDCIDADPCSPSKVYPESNSTPSQIPILEDQVCSDDKKWIDLWKLTILRVKAKIALKKLKNTALLYGTELDGDDYMIKKEASILQDASRKEQEINQMIKTEQEDLPLYILDPRGKFLQCWILVMGISILYTATYEAYLIAFTDREHFDTMAITDIILDFIFLLDLLISLFSSYKKSDGSYEAELSKIVSNYAKGWMIIDMISAVPYGVIDIIEGTEIKDVYKVYSFFEIGEIPKIYIIFRLVRTFKLVKSNLIGKFTKFLENYLSAPQAKTIIFALLICIFVNVTACIFYFAARVQGLNDTTWVGKYGIESEPTDTRYLCSIYWSITTLATIGYGDITPGNDLERCLCIIWMIFGVGFYSFTIGSLSSMISSIDAQQAVLDQKLYTVSEFADESQLDKETKDELREAIIYSSNQNGMSWSEKIDLFNELPRNLKYKIASKIYTGAVNKLLFFKKKDSTFIVQIVPHLTPHLMQDNEIIYEEGNLADEMYFILRGRVMLTYSPKNYVYKSYLKGSYFGEIEIIEKISRIDKVLTFGECEMLALSRTVFLQVLEDFPKESEYFKEIAQERKLKHIQAKQKLARLVNPELGIQNSKFKNIENISYPTNRSMLSIKETARTNNLGLNVKA